MTEQFALLNGLFLHTRIFTGTLYQNVEDNFCVKCYVTTI